MSALFDPKPSEPYGRCKNCDLFFADRDEMHAHLSETFDAGGKVNGKGHTGLVTNATRPERIRNHIGFAIENALYEFIDEVSRDVDRGDFTAEEVQEALRGNSDFYDAWAEADR